MGHKVHPTGIRLGISKDWNSKWFANKRQYAEYLFADLKVREMLRNGERPAQEFSRPEVADILIAAMQAKEG